MNNNKRNTKPYSKEDFFAFLTSISLPDEVTTYVDEEKKVVEFSYKGKLYAVAIDGENWGEVKSELSRQQFRKLEETNRMKELEQLDYLTKLYNKKYSRCLIEEYLKNSSAQSRHALMLIDIDNFNIVNDNLGYMFGDTVLVNIADSLNKIFYPTDIVSRIGGDEFLIFLKNVSSVELLEMKAKEIYSLLRNTYTGEDKDYKISCSIGISLYPKDGLRYEELFLHGDSALLEARKRKEHPICFYKHIEKESGYTIDDCYDKYIIKETGGYGASNFDKEITAFAFDIMSRTKDVKSAINLLLNRVRGQFKCSRICIIEKSVMEAMYHITYLSSDERSQSGSIPLDPLIDISFYSYLNCFNDSAIYCLNDTTAIEDDNIRTMFGKYKTMALLQCGIFEDDELQGVVSMEGEEKRYWTQLEKDSLTTITKIISSYLLKLRASERADKQLYNLRNYDALTGLPTLHKFKKDVTAAFKINKGQYVIVYSDISQFKYMNDSLGYKNGDKILCDFADFIKNKEGHLCCARVSEDNFLIVLSFREESDLRNYIIGIFEEFNVLQRMKYPGYKFIVASGASIIEPDMDITAIIDNANIARKSLKPATKTDCKFFDYSMREKLQKELEIINTMDSALKEHEFIVYIQPKIGLDDNKIVGGEALVRWRKPDNTIIPPNDFIPLFERNGFIVNLDFYIYEEVLKLISRWRNEGREVVPVSLNVSRVHLNNEKFVKEFKELVDKYKIPYSLLELELTESIFLSTPDIALNTMKEFRKLGFGVSIDDFGSGYSALTLLKHMATDVIKLDKEFFGNDEMNEEEKIIVSSIITMAKRLNMKVLSEGIETKNQSDFLKSVSCDMAQGFLFSKPVPAEEFERMLY